MQATKKPLHSLISCYARQSTIVKVAICMAIFAGWLGVSKQLVPPFVKSVYDGKASPAILNSLIRGQARHPLAHYQAKWRSAARKFNLVLGCSLLYLSINAVPAFHSGLAPVRRRLWRTLQYIGLRFGLWNDRNDGLLQRVRTWILEPCPEDASLRSAMSRRRELFIGAWILFFVTIELASALAGREWWPFSPNAMYSATYKDVFAQLEVCGVVGDEVILIAGRDNHLSAKLRKLHKKPEQLGPFLQELAQKHHQKHPGNEPFDSIQLRRLSWKMTPHGSANDPPLLKEVVFEIDSPAVDANHRLAGPPRARSGLQK